MSGTAWTATLGILGIVATTFGIWLGGRMSRNQAREQISEARDARVREITVDGYAAAREAVRWLSMMHVEDFADPKFADEFVPKTKVAVQRLRHAATQFTLASAMGGGTEFNQVVGETALALMLLDETWHDCADACRSLVDAKAANRTLHPMTERMHKRQFDENYERLQVVRTELIGFDGSHPPETELAEGGVREGSLLFRVRELTSAPTLT